MITAYFILYLLFQVGIGTFVRQIEIGSSDGIGYTRKLYLITLIPLFGIIFIVVHILYKTIKTK